MAGRGRKNADGALIAALAAGVPVATAAERAGVAERTAYRRLQDPAFRSQVDGARTRLVEQTVARLGALGDQAVDTLAELMKSEEKAAVRLGAARATLEHLLKGHDLFVLARRVEELEGLLAEVRGDGRRVDAASGEAAPGGQDAAAAG